MMLANGAYAEVTELGNIAMIVREEKKEMQALIETAVAGLVRSKIKHLSFIDWNWNVVVHMEQQKGT